MTCTAVSDGVSKDLRLPNLLEELKYFRINKCFAKDKNRLENSFTPGSNISKLWIKSVAPYICKYAKGEHKTGIAPATNLEREVQSGLGD